MVVAEEDDQFYLRCVPAERMDVLVYIREAPRQRPSDTRFP